MLPDTKLFEPYTNDLGRTMKWLARNTRAPSAVIDIVIYDTALELAQGKTFSTEKCDCGCGMEGTNTAIEHYMAKKAKRLQSDTRAETHKIFEEALTSRIADHLKEERLKLLAEEAVKATLWKNLKRNNWIIPTLVWILTMIYFLKDLLP